MAHSLTHKWTEKTTAKPYICHNKNMDATDSLEEATKQVEQLSDEATGVSAGNRLSNTFQLSFSHTPLYPIRFLLTLSYRDHRKIVVIDKV